jgi:hypothetical protein
MVRIEPSSSPESWRNPILDLTWVTGYQEKGNTRVVSVVSWTDEHTLARKIREKGIKSHGIIFARSARDWKPADHVMCIDQWKGETFRPVDSMLVPELLKTGISLVWQIGLQVKSDMESAIHWHDSHGLSWNHHGHRTAHNHQQNRWNWRSSSDGH